MHAHVWKTCYTSSPQLYWLGGMHSREYNCCVENANNFVCVGSVTRLSIVNVIVICLSKQPDYKEER